MLIKNGFTLIEISVVFFIIGLLLAGILTPLTTMIEQRNRQKTQEMLATIRENLIGYALVHGRLPCPDQNEDGIEDREGDQENQQCKKTGKQKTLPWATLGMMVQRDAWGQNFIYHATDKFADDAPCEDSHNKVSFCLSDTGDININKDTEGNKLISDPVLAVIVSTGLHDTSSTEQENTDGDADFIAGDYQGEKFDDMLIWVTSTVLMYQMVQAGKLP